MICYEIDQSCSGITVGYFKTGAYLAHFGVWFKLGSRDESSSMYGFVHMLEHMIIKLYIDDTKTLGDIFNQFGVDFELSTNHDYFYLLVSCENNLVPKVVKYVFQALANSIIDNYTLITEKEIILQEFIARKAKPEIVLTEKVYASMWDNILGHSILGNQETIKKFDVRIISQTLKAIFYNKEFCFLYSGMFDKDKIINLVDDTYMEVANSENIKTILQYREDRAAIKPDRIVTTEQSEVLWLGLGIPIPEHFNLRNKMILSMVSSILGGNPKSRLFKNIREENGLAYHLFSHGDVHRYENGLIINVISSPDKVKKLLKIIDKEIRKLKEKPCIEEELNVFKIFIKNMLFRSFDNPLVMLKRLGERLMLNEESSSREGVLKLVETINSKDIFDFCNQYMVLEHIGIAAIGPLKSIEDLNFI